MISWPIARATARERGTSLVVIACAVLLAMVGFGKGRADGWGAEAFTGIGQVFFLALTLALGAGLLADELESGHAQLVLLRPVTRAEWLGGRLCGAGLALFAATALAWVASFLGALRGPGTLAFGPRLLSLPLAFVWAFAWLAVLACVGAVARSWTNAGALILAGLFWQMFYRGFPLATGRRDLQPLFSRIDAFVGPQEPTDIAQALLLHGKVIWGPLFYDLLWLFGAWTVAVLLFNRRELARRSA